MALTSIFPNAANSLTNAMYDPNLMAQNNALLWHDTVQQRPANGQLGAGGKNNRGYVRQKFTRLETALYSLRKSGDDTTSFNAISGDRLIEALGWHNPVFRDKPTKFAYRLLNALSYGVKDGGLLCKAGLYYSIPGIIGCKRGTCRTSMASIKLMEYWAEKRPRFAPFLAAFLTEKAKTEIALHCVDLMMGNRPPEFLEIDRFNEEKIKEMREALAIQDAVDASKMQQLMAQRFNQAQQGQAMRSISSIATGGTAIPYSAASQQAMMAKQHDIAMRQFIEQQNSSLFSIHGKKASILLMDEASTLPSGLFDSIKNQYHKLTGRK